MAVFNKAVSIHYHGLRWSSDNVLVAVHAETPSRDHSKGLANPFPPPFTTAINLLVLCFGRCHRHVQGCRFCVTAASWKCEPANIREIIKRWINSRVNSHCWGYSSLVQTPSGTLVNQWPADVSVALRQVEVQVDTETDRQNKCYMYPILSRVERVLWHMNLFV